MKVRVGIDIGGVIIDRKKNDGTDTSFFGSHYLDATPVKDAFIGVTSLVADHGDANVFIVSKCGLDIEKKSREWLDHHDFYDQTGVLRENVIFCRTRAQKAPVCQQQRITVFVDDRPEVLSYMTTVPVLVHFGPFAEFEAEIGRWDWAQMQRVASASDWWNVLRVIRERTKEISQG